MSSRALMDDVAKVERPTRTVSNSQASESLVVKETGAAVHIVQTDSQDGESGMGRLPTEVIYLEFLDGADVQIGDKVTITSDATEPVYYIRRRVKLKRHSIQCEGWRDQTSAEAS